MRNALTPVIAATGLITWTTASAATHSQRGLIEPLAAIPDHEAFIVGSVAALPTIIARRARLFDERDVAGLAWEL